MTTINRQTYSLLEDLSKEDIFKEHKATLIGGTALAYHYGHRESFDIDICFPHNENLPKLPFIKKFNLIKNEFNNFIKDSAINEGGDIDTQIQRYIQKDTGLKVDFVVNTGSNIYESEILKNDLYATSFNNITIASPEVLFKQKSLLLLDRNKIRDLYDVAYLINKEKFTSKEIINTIKTYRITYTDKDIIRLLAAKQPNKLDIINEPISLAKIQDLTEYTKLKSYLLTSIDKSLSAKNKLKEFIKCKEATKDKSIKKNGIER